MSLAPPPSAVSNNLVAEALARAQVTISNIIYLNKYKKKQIAYFLVA